jgi:hypothetical protein
MPIWSRLEIRWRRVEEPATLFGALAVSVTAVTEVKAVSATDTFYGTSTGANITIGHHDSGFAYCFSTRTRPTATTRPAAYALYNNTTGFNGC